MMRFFQIVGMLVVGGVLLVLSVAVVRRLIAASGEENAVEAAPEKPAEPEMVPCKRSPGLFGGKFCVPGVQPCACQLRTTDLYAPEQPIHVKADTPTCKVVNYFANHMVCTPGMYPCVCPICDHCVANARHGSDKEQP